MFKKFVVLLTCIGVFQLSSCTSKDSKEDGGEEMAIDATATDSAEVEKVEGEQSLDIAAEDPSSASSLSTDALPEEALGESSTANQPSKSTPPTPEVAGSEPPPLETLPPDTTTLPPDTLSDSTAEIAPPVTETVEPTHETASSSKSSSEEPKADPKPVAAYRKVEQAPWKEGGKLLNTVYVARNGDSWGSVSQMIYGTERVSELKKMNPSIKGRKLKVGDKVYYNSPHRPDDSVKVLTFYEDSGIAPEVYIAKSGDNLKKVAKELFGSEQGWKELYATNDFESKAALDEGTQIKYWRTVPAEPKEVAQAQPTMPTPPTSLPPAPPQMNEAPPPPAPSEPIAEMPPPPPPPDMAANEMAPPPPPPPPPVEAVAPPAAPPKDMAKQNKVDDAASPLEDDQMTTLAAGAVVAVGLALFMIMRRRRKKELEQAIQDTQVG
ncbi:MAG TPA: LysM domain-containing protein [Pseudobdellovibrionaceae bacterium]|jgi:hypothetical protein